MRKLLYTLAALLVINIALAQTTTQNYVKSTIPKARVQSETALNGLGNDNKIENITYFDGLGRPIQRLVKQGGGQRQDIIIPIFYDEFGRQIKDYLPYARTPSNTLDGLRFEASNNLMINLNQQYLNKYPDDLDALTPNPFSEKVFEASPLNRVLEQAAPGKDWAVDNNHTIKFDYQTNTNTEVMYFDVDFVNGNTEQPKLIFNNQYYNQNKLYKTVTKDENWQTFDQKDHTTEEFKNKQGQVVLKRTYNNQLPHDTHYVYDEYGNLTFVLPPLASKKVKFYNLESTIISTSDLMIGGNPTGNLTIGIEKTGINTYEFVADFNLQNLSLSHFKLGEIADVPNLDPELGSYIYLGQLSEFIVLNNQGDYTYKYVSYYISNGKLYAYGSSSSNINGIYSQSSEVTFPSFINTHTINLPNTLEGLTEAETQENIQDVLDELCYQYKYDHRNRLVEKKIPSKGWEYIVYNKLDQPVLTQDANLKAQNKWLFTKYDAFGRVAYTGFMSSSSSRITFQNSVNNENVLYETKTSSSTTIAGTTIYYNNLAYPKVNITEIHTINYYDNYTFDKINGNSESAYGVTPITNVKGLPTGSKVRVLGTSDWITSVTYYDDKSRPIYIYSFNDYLNTTDKIKTELSFDGTVTETTTSHARNEFSTITIIDRFTYDHANRLLTQKQTINNQAEELIVKNHYDELGQLVKKDVGDTEVNPLQEIDYAYNIRGWLKQINDLSLDSGNAVENDLFALNIGYNTIGSSLYNGNISATQWRTNNTSKSNRTYYYYYDDLNRLKDANFYEWNKNSRFNVSLNYDMNGNISSLNRRGNIVENPEYNTNNHYGIMDNLAYNYKGNQLQSVTDSGSTQGFKDGNINDINNPDDYYYDTNGNMIEDKNKNITSIKYNHLNLPEEIVIYDESSTNDFVDNGTITYIYDATGTKLAKTLKNGSDLFSTHSTTTTQYSGNFIYKNGSHSPMELKFFSHPEGYVEPNFQGGFNYIYQYKDHLGNIRLSYKEKDLINAATGQSTEVFSDGFESASGWNSLGSTWGGSVTEFDSNFKYNGNYSARIYTNSTQSDAVAHMDESLQISNSDDTYYTISAWAYSDNPVIRLGAALKTADETGYATIFDEIVISDPNQIGRWIYIEKRLIVPEDITTINVRINAAAWSGREGNVWFDDVKIVKWGPVRVEIVEENNYYPFGLKHKGYNNVINGTDHPYGFGSKEENDELGLNWIDYGWRNFDASLGRWMSIDPLAEDYYDNSSYNYTLNNPILFVDPDGREVDVSQLQNSSNKEDQWLLINLMISLSDISGQKITKSTDNNNKTILIGDGCQGDCKSSSASNYIDHLLDPSSGTITVKGVNNGTKANAAGELHLDAKQIKDLQKSGKEIGVAEENSSVAMLFLHETLHTKVGADYFDTDKDKADKHRFGAFGDPKPADRSTSTGPTVDRMNAFRIEMNLPIRYKYGANGSIFLQFKDGKKVEVPAKPKEKK